MNKTHGLNSAIGELAELDAWRKISETYPLTAAQLEKFHEKLDWEYLSMNERIKWTLPMLEQHSDDINWSTFSKYCHIPARKAKDFLEKFENEVDWTNISNNDDFELTYELIDTYIDRWDWDALLHRYNCELYTLEFVERYKDKIDANVLFASECWARIVLAQTQALEEELEEAL